MIYSSLSEYMLICQLTLALCCANRSDLFIVCPIRVQLCEVRFVLQTVLNKR